MKKILYIHQYFNTTNHAGSTRSFEFSKRLAEKKLDVTVLTGTFLGFDDFDSSKGNFVLDGIKVHNFGIGSVDKKDKILPTYPKQPPK